MVLALELFFGLQRYEKLRTLFMCLKDRLDIPNEIFILTDCTWKGGILMKKCEIVFCDIYMSNKKYSESVEISPGLTKRHLEMF